MKEFFKVGDSVAKNCGDYRFTGWVAAVFAKRSGLVRYVVEDERGMLMIMSENQLSFAP